MDQRELGQWILIKEENGIIFFPSTSNLHNLFPRSLASKHIKQFKE